MLALVKSNSKFPNADTPALVKSNYKFPRADTPALVKSNYKFPSADTPTPVKSTTSSFYHLQAKVKTMGRVGERPNGDKIYPRLRHFPHIVDVNAA